MAATVTDLEAKVAALASKYEQLQEDYKGMAETVSISAGLTEISNSIQAELAPLRQLVPPTTTQEAEPEVLKAIENIRTASQAPTWERIPTLGVKTWSIPWIGAPKPPRRSASGNRKAQR